MRRYTLTTLALMAFFLLSSAAMAQQPQHGSHQPGQGQGDAQQMGAGPDEPGLFGMTEEKQAAVAKLRAEYRQAVMHLRLQLKAKQAELDVLLAAPQADQGKISTVTNEITALHGKILAAQNDFRRKVFEETGHLVGGGMDHDAKGHGMSCCKAMSKRGQMRSCPMMSAPQADQAE